MFNTTEVAKYIKLTTPSVDVFVNLNNLTFSNKGKRLSMIKSELEKWILKVVKKTKLDIDM